MRAWLTLGAGAAVYAAAVVWAAGRLPPDGVPLHFDAAGAADRLGSRGAALTAMGLVGVGMLALGAGLVLLIHRGPLRSMNLPHREYWLTEERRPRLRRMLALDMAVIMGGTLAYLSFIPVSTALAAAAPDRAVPPVVLWTPTAVYFPAVLALVVWIARYRYRPRADR